MVRHEARDVDFESRVRESFDQQDVMSTIGAALTVVAPGHIEIELPYHRSLTQQHNFLHAGVVAIIADSACGYAAMSLTPRGADVVAVEFKINLLSPAVGDSFVARGQVERSGRRITVCRADVFARHQGGEKLVATMLGTIMTQSRDDGV